MLNGAIKGNAAAGYLGGSFSLTTGGAVDLDNLSVELAQSGVTNSITVDASTGNLVLDAGYALTAHAVSLTADDGTGDLTNTTTGNVKIYGTINASGFAGGEIDLYGKNNVDIEGTLLARACLVGIACDEATDQHVLTNAVNPFERGGTINIGTSATFNGNSYDPTYGYEDFTTSGGITLGSNALIDVSGGSLGGLSGGTGEFPPAAAGRQKRQYHHQFVQQRQGCHWLRRHHAGGLCGVEHHRRIWRRRSTDRRTALRWHRRSRWMVQRFR